MVNCVSKNLTPRVTQAQLKVCVYKYSQVLYSSFAVGLLYFGLRAAMCTQRELGECKFLATIVFGQRHDVTASPIYTLNPTCRGAI